MLSMFGILLVSKNMGEYHDLYLKDRYITMLSRCFRKLS